MAFLSRSAMMKDNAQPYTYKSLKHTTNAEKEAIEIRLITIHSAFGGEDIRLSLTHAVLSEVRDQYNAISYTWGSPDGLHQVWIDGCYILVRDNIYRFLKHRIQYASSSKARFWIDSICINQEDVREKSSQVEAMRYIFAQAKEVQIWLGEASEEDPSSLLTEFDMVHSQYISPSYARTAAHERSRASVSFRRLYRKASDNDKHRLNLILGNEYWWRLWIVQENILAQEVFVTVGSAQFKLTLFADIVDFEKTTQEFGIPQTPQIEDLQSGRGFGFLRNRAGKVWLHTALRQFHSQRCQDSRDKVYGLLGLTDYTGSDLRVDYNCSLESLLVDTMSLMQAEMSQGRCDDSALQCMGLEFVRDIMEDLTTIPESVVKYLLPISSTGSSASPLDQDAFSLHIRLSYARFKRHIRDLDDVYATLYRRIGRTSDDSIQQVSSLPILLDFARWPKSSEVILLESEPGLDQLVCFAYNSTEGGYLCQPVLQDSPVLEMGMHVVQNILTRAFTNNRKMRREFPHGTYRKYWHFHADCSWRELLQLLSVDRELRMRANDLGSAD